MSTLLFSTILLTAATLLVFTLARSGLAQQRIFQNSLLSEKLQQTSEAALAVAINHLRQLNIVWQSSSDGTFTYALVFVGDQLGQDPSIHSQILYTRIDASTPYIEIMARSIYPNKNPSLNDSEYTVRTMIHYTIINTVGSQTGYQALVVPVPGTWHDFGL